jgi:alpha-glucosidase
VKHSGSCSVLLLMFLAVWPIQAQVVLASPNGKVQARIEAGENGSLCYSVTRKGITMVSRSRMGVTRDGIDLGEAVLLGRPVFSAIDETYPILGGKRMARNYAQAVTLPIESAKVKYKLEARAYNDGFAWRILVPGVGRHRVQGEASSWTLPFASKVWYGERNNSWKLKSYAGEWLATNLELLPTVSGQGPVQAPPLVAQTPEGVYLVISEAALVNYSGMRLRATGGGRVQADFFEGSSGFVVDGAITTPWRVVMMSEDLNGLVNSDLITNLNPPPDPVLFADRSYIKPGRTVWRFWSRQTGTPAQERQFVDYAVQLGFEYTLVDDGWKDWPHAWQEMTGLCTYARAKGIGVFAWKDYQYIHDPADHWRQLREFLDRSRQAGLAGVKIDFINGESKERIDFERAALLFAAQRRLMVDFHGIQKPSGEVRTFPNAITREGIRGLELNRMKEGPIPASHNAALPFTRFVVGYGDYTPLSYTWPGPTTWAHQLATVVAFTSPFMTIAEDPEVLLHDPSTRPGLEVLEHIPSVWDETVVLAPSSIGKLAMIARRSGRDWFLAVLNGSNLPLHLASIDLSFLGRGRYSAEIVTSPERRALAQRDEPEAGAQTQIGVDLSGGDGLVAWFKALP